MWTQLTKPYKLFCCTRNHRKYPRQLLLFNWDPLDRRTVTEEPHIVHTEFVLQHNVVNSQASLTQANQLKSNFTYIPVVLSVNTSYFWLIKFKKYSLLAMYRTRQKYGINFNIYLPLYSKIMSDIHYYAFQYINFQ